MAPPSPAQVAAITELVKNTWNTRFTSLAAMAIVLFEHAITFGEEYNLIWAKPWSRSKALFIWNRYATLGVMLVNTVVWVGGRDTNAGCKRWFLFQGMTGWLTNMTVQVIIQIRIAALFGKDKRVVIPMVIGFCIQGLAMISIVIWQLTQRSATAYPAPGIRICVLDMVPPLMWTYWLINLVYEGCLVSLAIWKAYQSWKFGTVDVRRSKKSASLFEILIRDSIYYFVLIFLTYILNLVSWYIGRKSLYQIAIALAIGIRCAMGSRLLLNIRAAYYSGPTNGVTTGGGNGDHKTAGQSYNLSTMKVGIPTNMQLPASYDGSKGASQLDTTWAMDASADREDDTFHSSTSDPGRFYEKGGARNGGHAQYQVPLSSRPGYRV